MREASWIWAALSGATIVGLNLYYWRQFMRFWRGEAFVLRGINRKPGESEYEEERNQHANMLAAVAISTIGTIVAIAVWALRH